MRRTRRIDQCGYPARRDGTAQRALLLPLAMISMLVLGGCEGAPGTPQGPDQYLENPVVKTAIEQSDFPVHRGNSPPRLSGVYATSGRVVAASTAFQTLRSAPVRSEIRLFNQTASGAIRMSESVQGTQVVESTGGYVTGDGAAFTIWQTSRQDLIAQVRQIDPSARWPFEGGCIMGVALLMSGRKASDGDLQDVEGLTSVIDLDCPGVPAAARQRLANAWYKWQANFDLR